MGCPNCPLWVQTLDYYSASISALGNQFSAVSCVCNIMFYWTMLWWHPTIQNSINIIQWQKNHKRWPISHSDIWDIYCHFIFWQHYILYFTMSPLVTLWSIRYYVISDHESIVPVFLIHTLCWIFFGNDLDYWIYVIRISIRLDKLSKC